MQYLLKVSLNNTSVWRLVAVDGSADRAFIGDLIALSFDYPVCKRHFVIGGSIYTAGSQIKDSSELIGFDSFNLQSGDKFEFVCELDETLAHTVEVMKCEEKLYCVMPSTLVGAGLLPENGPYNYSTIENFVEGDETPSLDLRLCTTRMRALGVMRADAHQALLKTGADVLKFNME